MELRWCSVSVVLMVTASCGQRAESPIGAHEQLPHVAADLVKYRNDSRHWGHGGGVLSTDSERVFDAIEDYPLLRAVILDPRSEPQVIRLATERALLLVGPTRVFSDVQRDARTSSELFGHGVRLALLKRTYQSHVWVDASAFIEGDDMPRPEARKVLQGIIDHVQRGASFDHVYVQAQREHQYRKGPLLVTRIGNYGDFVLSEMKPDARPFRPVSVPTDHIERLLSARPGDVVMLDDDRDHPSVILYRVREVYDPRQLSE